MNSFFKKIYRNLLCVKHSDTNLDQDRKQLTLKVYLYVTSSTLFFFTLLHAFFYQGVSDKVLILELLACLTLLYAIFALKRHQNTNWIAHFTTLSLSIFILTFVYWNQDQNFGLIWIIFLPIYAMTINGPTIGLRYSLAFVFILLMIAYDGIGHWQSGQWNEMSFIRLTMASLILVFISYVNEVSLTNAKYDAKMALDELHKLSTIDELTQISNRRHINQALSQSIQSANRHGYSLSLVLFDIDNFKKINDEYGHLVGDCVLLETATVLRESIRKTDLFGRWGGEEFLIILPNEDKESAYQFSEKLRQTIEKTSLTKGPTHITCSFGVAQLQNNMSAEQLVELTDQALYKAKHAGKNQVVVFDELNEQIAIHFA